MLDLKSISLSSASKAMLENRGFVHNTDRLHVGMNQDMSKFVVRLNDENNHFTSRNANLWAEATPGATRVKKKQEVLGDYWSMQATDFTVLRISHTWKDSQVTFADDVSAVTFASIYTRFVSGEANARRVEEWTQTKNPVDLPIQPKPELPPNSYQTIAAMNGMSSQGFLMGMEQGTGKTYPTILIMAEAACRAKARGDYFRGLVVCPNNVRLNWEREIDKFSPVPLIPGIVVGDQGKRVSKLVELFAHETPPSGSYGAVAIASYAAGAETCLILKHLGISIDFHALDESHIIKNPLAAITKQMLDCREVSKKRVCLTGTPIGNHVFDLWSQLEFLFPGASGFTDFPSFKKYYSKKIPFGASTEEKIAALQNLPMLRERLARNAFIVTKKVALPYLPEKVYSVVDIALSKKQQQAYDTLAENLALSIQKDIEDAEHGDKNRNLIINNALTKSLKLTQITSGFIKWDAEVHPVTGEILAPAWQEEFKENPKVDWLIKEIKEAPKDEKFIIWCYQTFGQDIILKRLQANGIGVVRFNGDVNMKDRNRIVDEFNDEILKDNHNAYDPLESPCKVFLGNAASAGAGLNLLGYPIGRPDLSPCNACRIIRYSYNYSHIERSQSDDRSHRVGTRVPQRYETLIGAGTIERKIHKVLEAKAENALDATDLRDILSELARIKDD